MLLTQKHIQVIIPAAGKPTNTIIPNTTLSDTMVPINGKPILGYIIEDILQRGVQNIILVLNSSDFHAKEYVTKKFENKCNLKIMLNNKIEKGIGYSLFIASKLLDTKKQTLVYLGDTIYKGRLNFAKDSLVVSKEFDEPEKWCILEKNKEKLVFINKPKEYSGKGSALCGIYFFKDSRSLIKIISQLETSKKKFEIKDILENYSKKHTFELVPAIKWYDCGNIENYYKARIDFLKIRKFNKIHYNDLYGYIVKSGNNKDKLGQEINWYVNVPNQLKIFSPRLIDYNLAKDSTWYSLEFYGYPSLADLFVFNSLDIQVWKIVIERLFTITSLFRKYASIIPYASYYDMYITKTKKRLDLLINKPFWKSLLDKETVYINKKSYKNIFQLFPMLEKYTRLLYDKKEMSFIHGDLCMSNILFDPSSRIFKFIDPGGRFGQTGIYGDIKYDIAKMRHSFSGLYDFIVSDLFTLKEDKFSFTLSFFSDLSHKEIKEFFDCMLEKNGYNLEKIKLIEGLLFISMIPLHSDNIMHQKAMFCQGIMILNDVLSKNDFVLRIDHDKIY